jgi:hypothetical protein
MTEVTLNKLVDLVAPILYVQRELSIMWVGVRNIVTHQLQHCTCTFLFRPPCEFFVQRNKEIQKQQIGKQSINYFVLQYD